MAETFRLQTAPGPGFLRISISGPGDDGQAAAIVSAVADAVRSAAARRVLIDVRGVRGRIGVSDTYFLVKRYPADLQLVPTAVLESAEHRSLAQFHETAAANIGRNLRFFFDEKDALAWLATQA